MKTTILIITLSISAFTKAQTYKALDTIYANDTKNVALFFPEPIRQGITGSDNFVFTYNREKEQYFGLLQAKPGKESNLLVLNRNGSIFSYIVRYKKQLSKLNYFIPSSSSIGNEKPIVTDSIQAETFEKRIDNRTYYYQKFCSYLLNRHQRIGRIKKRNEGIVLSVENIVFDKEELYFVIQIENISSLDYDLNFLNLSIETRQKGKKKSLQRLYQEPIYKHNLPSKIAENKTIRFVYVLPKFSLSNDRRAILELNEKDGERNIELKISHRYINNPN
ncbi:MAG: conjugal transfer protein TraN [Flavobacteriaceae bacterium]|nr:conjugal transfer protein TraN [Flavobacteriaceae bacterium]|tara:strand:+ start:4716 stop:5546 length:831 start_codon:yes stop_codon:yes gene_type:complete